MDFRVEPRSGFAFLESTTPALETSACRWGAHQESEGSGHAVPGLTSSVCVSSLFLVRSSLDLRISAPFHPWRRMILAWQQVNVDTEFACVLKQRASRAIW